MQMLRIRPSPGFRVAVVLAGVILSPGPAGAQSATATNTYDDAGRLKSTAYSDGMSASYAYDPAGNRTSTAEGIPVQMSIANASATEGGTLNFTVTKTGTATGTVSIDCVQVNGTATAGSDFTASTQTLTFLIADTSKTCSVVSLQDTAYEGAHIFNAVLQNPVGAVQIADGSGLGTINDNDPAPSFSVSGGSVAEGLAISFTITKSGSTQLSHAVSYATANGTATTADGDYSSVSSSRTFAPSETSFVVQVPTTTDAKYEVNETVLLNLSSPTNGATIATGQATGTINNNDAAPSFSINDPPAVNEGGAIVFTVTKLGSTALSHGFNWAAANGTATSPSDYTAASGSITFTVADTQKTIQVQTVTDGVADSAQLETILVNLTTNAGSNGGTLSDSQGIGNVADLQGIPGVPPNIRKSPTSGTGPNYSILWDAPTGTVNHYTLEEVEIAPGSGTTTYSVATTSKSFSKGDVYLDLTYRVRACATANESQCSAYSGSVFKLVCPASGCP